MLIGMILLIFVVTTGAAYLLLGGVSRPQDRVQERLGVIGSQRGDIELFPPQHSDNTGNSREDKAASRGVRPDLLPALTRLLSGSAIGDNLRASILRAGMRLRPAEFVILCVLCSVGGGLAGYILTRQSLFLATGGLFGLYAPVLVMQQKQGQRRRSLESQIPDALTLIASSMRSGYSFLRAMKLVVDELPAPMSEEFGRVLGEVELGVSTQTALERMVTRVRSRDLELVIIAITIQMQVGGNLAEILDTIAETIRERIRIQGEIKSLTAEGKLSGIILFLLPLGLALMLQMRDPKYFKALLEAPQGPMIIGGAIVLQLLGGFVIKKMVTLDV
jgi:tight adherence protein B